MLVSFCECRSDEISKVQSQIFLKSPGYLLVLMRGMLQDNYRCSQVPHGASKRISLHPAACEHVPLHEYANQGQCQETHDFNSWLQHKNRDDSRRPGER